MAQPAGATARIPITTNPASIPATMPDGIASVFPTDFEFQEGGDNDEGDIRDFVDGLAADYSDLRVTQADGETIVPFGMRQFSQTPGSRELNLGLGVSSLSSAVGTKFYLYRGCTGGQAEDRAGVVPTASGFQGMWPLEAQNSGAATGASIYADWTSNGFTGDDYVSDTGKIGQVGQGQQFDGANDYIDVGAQGALQPAQYFYSFWWYPQAFGAYEAIMVNGWIFNNTGIRVLRTNTNSINLYQGIGGSHVLKTGTGVYAASAWHHIVGQYDGSRLHLFVDGVEDGLGFLCNAPAWTAANPLWLGKSTIRQFTGRLDEFYFGNVVRSADWIKTVYENQKNNDTFWTVGAEEAVGGGGLPQITARIFGRRGPSLAGVR